MNFPNLPDMLIIGTDTGVGKTVFSMLWMRFLIEQGYDPFYFKPFQSGCKSVWDTDSDAKFVCQSITGIRQKVEESVGYCLPEPKAPWFAAKNAGVELRLDAFQDLVAEKKATHSSIVMEAAGGLMVPITDQTLVIDLVNAYGLRPILVGRAGLGTINHTLLSLDVLKQRGIEPIGVVLMDTDGETPQVMQEENMEAIRLFSSADVFGVLPRIDDFRQLGTQSEWVLNRVLLKLQETLFDSHPARMVFGDGKVGDR